MHIDLRHFVAQSNMLGMKRIKRRKLLPDRPSKAIELWYKVELLRIVRLLRETSQQDLLPVLKQYSSMGDALPADVSHTISMMSPKFGNVKQTATRLSKAAAMRNKTAVDKQFIDHVKKAIGVDIQGALSDDAIRDEMNKAIQANVDLITSIPEQYFDKLRQNLVKNWTSGDRWEDVVGFVEHVGDVTESRAKLIARDQTAKMNSAFSRVRQVSAGIRKYQWQTAHDERVRETHRANDGKVFSWDKPPSETGNPGEDVNCRCVAIPIFELEDEDE